MIVVVMLSSTADIKKVMIDSKLMSSLRLLRVLMWSVMTWNPPCRSISSTNGHGADQEEEDFARIAELLDQLRADLGVVAQQTQYRPERTAHQQGDRGLVDA